MPGAPVLTSQAAQHHQSGRCKRPAGSMSTGRPPPTPVRLVRYRDAGIHDVHAILYPGARHELLNGTNRDEVTADVLAFLDRTVGP